MKPAERIVAALAANAPTAELLSRLAPEVQENVKGGWAAVIQAELDVLVPSSPAAATPSPDPAAAPAAPPQS
jgi:hypothetical protein